MLFPSFFLINFVFHPDGIIGSRLMKRRQTLSPLGTVWTFNFASMTLKTQSFTSASVSLNSLIACLWRLGVALKTRVTLVFRIPLVQATKPGSLHPLFALCVAASLRRQLDPSQPPLTVLPKLRFKLEMNCFRLVAMATLPKAMKTFVRFSLPVYLHFLIRFVS